MTNSNSIGCADLTCCDKLKVSVNPKLVCFRRLLVWLLWERTLKTWWHDNYIRIKNQNKISENQNQERPLHLHFLAFKYILKSTSDSLCHSLPIWRSTPQPFGCRRSLTAQSILWQIWSGTVKYVLRPSTSRNYQRSLRMFQVDRRYMMRSLLPKCLL